MSSTTPLAAAILLGFATQAAAYDPYPFQRSDGKWGYVDDDHCWVIAPQFESAATFMDELANVVMNGENKFIDRCGKVVIRALFSSIQSFLMVERPFLWEINGAL